MKKDIHPKYNNKSEVSCACGTSFTVGSTMEKIDVEICSQCHPFYTGNEKVLDTAGRVDRFKKRVASAKTVKTKK
jgi:large subunit ribosomal protein L31